MSANEGLYLVVRPGYARRLSWSWRCFVEGCRSVGLDCSSERSAEREAARHVARAHK